MPSWCSLLLLTIFCVFQVSALPSEQIHDDAIEHLETYLHERRGEGLSDPNHGPQRTSNPDFALHFNDPYQIQRPDETALHSHLVPLLQTYLSTMHTLNLDTFPTHSTLLSWSQTRHLAPSTTNLSVMLSERSIRRLAAWHNMTVHTFRIPRLGEDREYLLAVNPDYVRGGRNDDGSEAVDARWVDMGSGLFIDITMVRGGDEEGTEEEEGLYRVKDVFPLEMSVLEGFPVGVPWRYREILWREYGVEIEEEDGGESEQQRVAV